MELIPLRFHRSLQSVVVINQQSEGYSSSFPTLLAIRQSFSRVCLLLSSLAEVLSDTPVVGSLSHSRKTKIVWADLHFRILGLDPLSPPPQPLPWNDAAIF